MTGSTIQQPARAVTIIVHQRKVQKQLFRATMKTWVRVCCRVYQRMQILPTRPFSFISAGMVPVKPMS